MRFAVPVRPLIETSVSSACGVFWQVVIALALCWPTLALGSTRTFRVGQQAYDGADEVTISTQNASSTAGNGLSMQGEELGCYRVDGAGGYETRVLMRFGKLALPAGARLTAATLTLFFDNWSTGLTLRGRYLKVPWDPAAKRFGWLRRGDEERWSKPGADGVGKDTLAEGGFAITTLAGKGEESATVDLDPAVVGGWVKDPAAARRGLLLVNEDVGKVTRLHTSRAKQVDRRPLLTLTYLAPGEAPAVASKAPEAAAQPAVAIDRDSRPATPGRPRVLVNREALLRIAARIKAGPAAAAWARLRGTCDGYLTGTVEWPDGNRYPKTGSIGEGYQGSDYYEALLNTGLCFQVARLVAPDRAERYGKKGAEILEKMSAPSGPHAVNPLRDSGFGIRFYGIGMAVGYDWLFDALGPAQRARLAATLFRWIALYEEKGFGRDHPQGNYYAGYYAAKGLAALATAGDAPEGEGQWGDFLHRVQRGLVQPYYAAHLSGGGWPEGWNYGPLATINMSLPALAAKTARGLDLIHDPKAPFLFPIEQGAHLMHFTWPTRRTLDDRQIQFGGENPSRAGPDLFTAQAGILEAFGDPTAPVFHRFARAVREAQSATASPWEEVLFWDPDAKEADFRGLPRSYLAQGMDVVSMRSSWDTDAVWSTFAAGTYVNNPESGEQHYDQGSLVILRGGRQLLVNAVGALGRYTPGTQDGDRYDDPVYADLYNRGNRTLFNIFYVDRPRPYGQDAISSDDARTRIGRFEDGGDYVVVRGDDLQDMYRGKRKREVLSWTREVIYLRPQIFVVSDRTTVGHDDVDQWLAFHVAKSVLTLPPPCLDAGRFEIGKGADFAGGVTTLLPRGQRVKTVSLFDRGKIFRLEVRPQNPGTEQRWLTVFDAAATRGEQAQTTRLSAQDGNVLAGEEVGALLARQQGNQVVLLPGQERKDGEVRYVVPARDTAHLLGDVAPDTGFAVRVTGQGAKQEISVTAGGGLRSSHGGVLRFHTTAGGQVSP